MRTCGFTCTNRTDFYWYLSTQPQFSVAKMPWQLPIASRLCKSMNGGREVWKTELGLSQIGIWDEKMYSSCQSIGPDITHIYTPPVKRFRKWSVSYVEIKHVRVCCYRKRINSRAVRNYFSITVYPKVVVVFFVHFYYTTWNKIFIH